LAHLILIIIAGALWRMQWWFLLRSSPWGSSLAKPAGAVVKIREAGVVLSALRIFSYLRNSHFILAVFLPFMLFAFPAFNLQLPKKAIGKIFARTRKFCPKKLNLSSRIKNTTQAAR